MSFVSGFFVLLIGFINLRPENVGIIKKCSYWIIGIISVITFWTILIIIKQHRQYLIYRNIQRKLQSKMRIQDIKINDSKIFPKDWTTFQKQNLFTGWQGWLFYVLFILGLAIITALIVINL